VPIKISVIVPTYNRSQFLKKVLDSLLSQTLEKPDYEIIVVDDGSKDNTLSFLNSVNTQCNFRFERQENTGLSAARNHGASFAKGEILLFIDDDIVASPDLIKEHLLSHSSNNKTKAIIGSIKTDRGILNEPMASFFEYSFRSEYQRMVMYPETVDSNDVRGGNLSISKDIFLDLGMFDEEFGRIANEDGEFAYRFEKKGGCFIFNPNAIGYHLYQKGFKESLNKAYDQGRAVVLMQKKHPESIWKYDLKKFNKGPFLKRLIRGFFLKVDDKSFISETIISLLNLAIFLPLNFFRFPLLRVLLDSFFWQGVRDEAKKNGGTLLRYRNITVPILAYHRIGEGNVSDLREYSLTIKSFRKQMRYLKEKGFNSISIKKLFEFLKTGEPLPKNPIAITFDDGFKETLDNAIPILEKYGLKATFFIVSGKTGGENDWDKKYKESSYSLASFDEIKKIKGEMLEFESHSLTHQKLSTVSGEELLKEIVFSKQILEANLGKDISFFSYPYGKYGEEIKKIVKEAGYSAAFSVNQGKVMPGDDLFELKRVEIFRSDGFLGFLFKVKKGICIKKYFKNIILRKS